MANRKATFAKRQRESDLKERAKQKEDRRSQKRTEVRENKGPAIAWDEAVRAVVSDELPPLGTANEQDDSDSDSDTDSPAPPAAPATTTSATASKPT